MKQAIERFQDEISRMEMRVRLAKETLEREKEKAAAFPEPTDDDQAFARMIWGNDPLIRVEKIVEFSAQNMCLLFGYRIFRGEIPPIGHEHSILQFKDCKTVIRSVAAQFIFHRVKNDNQLYLLARHYGVSGTRQEIYEAIRFSNLPIPSEFLKF